MAFIKGLLLSLLMICCWQQPGRAASWNLSAATPTDTITGCWTGSAYLTYGNNGYFWASNPCANPFVYTCQNLYPTIPGNQTVSLVSSLFPNQTSLLWNWPYQASFSVAPECGAPEVIIGLQFGGNSNQQAPPAGTLTLTPIVLNSATDITMTYSVAQSYNAAIDNGYYSTFVEMYPADAGGSGVTLTRELSVFLHTDTADYAYWGPGGSCSSGDGCTIKKTYTSSCFSGSMVLDTSQTSGGNTGGRILVMPSTNTDQLSGCIDILDMINFAIAQGMMLSGKYLNGIELASEIGANSGYTVIKCLKYVINGTTYGSC